MCFSVLHAGLSCSLMRRPKLSPRNHDGYATAQTVTAMHRSRETAAGPRCSRETPAGPRETQVGRWWGGCMRLWAIVGGRGCGLWAVAGRLWAVAGRTNKRSNNGIILQPHGRAPGTKTNKQTNNGIILQPPGRTPGCEQTNKRTNKQSNKGVILQPPAHKISR